MDDVLKKDQASIEKIEGLLAGCWADDFKDSFRSLFEYGTLVASDDVYDWLREQVKWTVTVNGEVKS